MSKELKQQLYTKLRTATEDEDKSVMTFLYEINRQTWDVFKVMGLLFLTGSLIASIAANAVNYIKAMYIAGILAAVTLMCYILHRITNKKIKFASNLYKGNYRVTNVSITDVFMADYMDNHGILSEYKATVQFEFDKYTSYVFNINRDDYYKVKEGTMKYSLLVTDSKIWSIICI